MRVLLCVCVVVAGLCGIQGCDGRAASPNPLTISKGTTYITEPLKPNGEPDYAAWMSRRFGSGVTAENNLAAGLLEAVKPREDRRKLVERLGLKADPARPPLEFPEDLDAELNEAERRAWEPAEHADLAAWIGQNGAGLDRLVEVSRRERWYVPVPQPGPGELLLTKYVDSMFLGETRRCARLVIARANLRAGLHELRPAMEDLAAVRRIGGVLGTQSATLIERLVGLAIEGMVDRAVIGWVESKRLRGEEATAVLRWAAENPPRSRVAEPIDEAERVFSLDAMLLLRRDFQAGVETLIPSRYDAYVPGTAERRREILAMFKGVHRSRVDWDKALQLYNRRVDEVVAVSRKSRFAQRIAAAEESGAFGKVVIDRVATGPGDDPERWIVDFVAAPMSWGFESNEANAVVVLDLARVTADVARVGLALDVYRTQRGEYPEKLEQLAPAVLGAVPDDFCSGGALVYRRTADGFVLYSVGRNMRDDGGKDNDIVVRVGKAE